MLLLSGVGGGDGGGGCSVSPASLVEKRTSAPLNLAVVPLCTYYDGYPGDS